MGMSHLSEIVNIFKEVRGSNEVIGIIQNGTRTNEQSLFSNLDEVQDLVEKSQLSSPAIIVIGEVVKFNKPSVLEKVEEMSFC